MPFMTAEFIQKAILNPLENEKCWQLHSGVSCNRKMCEQFVNTFKSLHKVYLLAHLLPFLLFKRKKTAEKPKKELKKLIFGFINSMLFCTGQMTIARRVVCFLNNHYKFTSFNAVVGAFLGASSILFEHPSRQPEIALFTLNKSTETLYNMALRRKYPVSFPHGECFLIGFSIAILCYFFIDCPSAFRQSYKKILDNLMAQI